MSLLHHVRRYSARHMMWRPDTRVIAAVSGGSDSVAMLRLLHDLHCLGELRLEAVAHLHHRIRPEADDDEAFCRSLAAELRLPFESIQRDVPALARERRQSIEVSARIARRHFLDNLRRTRGADCIATAHTEDDQAETVMLRIMRGAGQRGLSGIAPCHDRRIRPVLCATRAELRHELTLRHQQWREDATNADLANPRNRVRHELLPYLAQHFNASAKQALARLADAARADDALLAREAAAAATAVVHRDADCVRVDSEMLVRLPQAVARRVVIHAFATLGTGAARADLVSVVLDVARGERGATDIPRFRVEPFGGFVVLVPKAIPSAPQPFRAELAIPGEVQLNGGWMLEAAGPFGPPYSKPSIADVAHIDAAAVGSRLVVRSRQPGDRLRPLGLGGSKKLQDILVDRKVPRAERDGIPVVTDSGGRIVWLAGHVISEEFRVTEGTKAVIILKLRRI